MSLFLHFLSIIESRLRKKKSSWTHFKVPNRSTFKNDLKLQSKNLSLIFQKIVEHLEKSCDQRAKKKWTYTFLPYGHYYHVIYTSLQDSHDLRDPRSRRWKNQVKSALYSNFWRLQLLSRQRCERTEK